MDIRTIIEKKIEQAGLTKKEVADRMGIIPSNINAMIASPSWPTLEKLSQALGISIAELVADAESVVVADDFATNTNGESVIRYEQGGQKMKISVKIEPDAD